MRTRSLRPVTLEFLDAAPRVITSSAVVAHPVPVVFAAVTGDPATWTWFPGFSDRGRWLTEPPHGVGSTREVTMSGSVFTDTVLAWDEPTRWAFRVETATGPLLRALVEDYRFEADGERTLVRWTFAADPSPLLGAVLASPAGPFGLQRLWGRAAANLERRLSATSRPPAGRS
jgi:hypothetical protein